MKVIDKIKSKTTAIPFLYPVDVVALNIPDYLDIIKQPMDLSTVSHKLNTQKYSTLKDFLSDTNLIFTNAMEYNLESSEIYQNALETQNEFKKLTKLYQIDKHVERKLNNANIKIMTFG